MQRQDITDPRKHYRIHLRKLPLCLLLGLLTLTAMAFAQTPEPGMPTEQQPPEAEIDENLEPETEIRECPCCNQQGGGKTAEEREPAEVKAAKDAAKATQDRVDRGREAAARREGADVPRPRSSTFLSTITRVWSAPSRTSPAAS